MSELRETAAKLTFVALESLFFEIFQNGPNRRVLHICSLSIAILPVKIGQK